MDAQLDPMLTVMPFDDKMAIDAKILVHPDARSKFVYKSFLLFVLELRSAMNEESLSFLKKNILQLCFEMLERGGIDKIGFVINQKYYTIRNPNYQGIKDLLTAHMAIEDTTDIRQTIQCLRHSIMNEGKKIQDCKLTLFWFSSNVKENSLAPTKVSYRKKKNAHLQNYFSEISKLRATIQEYCIDSRFYTICYANKQGIVSKENNYLFNEQSDQDNTYFDISLLYSIANCTNRQQCFHYCSSFSNLVKNFQGVVALILYDFHEFSIMIPVTNNRFNQFTHSYDTYMEEQQKQKQKGQKMEQDEEQFEEQEIDGYRQANTQRTYVKLRVFNKNEAEFRAPSYIFLDRQELDLQNLHDQGYHIVGNMKKQKKPLQFPVKKKMMKYILWHFSPNFTSKNVDYHQPTPDQLILCKSLYYKEELRQIMRKIETDIISFKRRYIGNRQYQYYIEVNDSLQFKLRERVNFIDTVGREIYDMIFSSQQIRNQKLKRKMYELYSSLKIMIDTAQEVIMKALKKQISDNDIAALSKAISYDKIKSSLKRKLIKRVNANPKLIDQTYERVSQICDNINTVELQAQFRYQKSEVGNCMYSFDNFATALAKNDCIGLVFEIQRPDSAIADPGKIRIRQISTMVCTVENFFAVHLYKIQKSYQQASEIQMKAISKMFKQDKKGFNTPCPICWSLCSFADNPKFFHETHADDGLNVKRAQKLVLQNFGIDPKGYQQRWDYWNKVERKKTFLGIMPLYVCQQNWKVAKLFMKLCMGWNCCGEPLGYTYSQMQTVPFMILTHLMRSAQQVKYKMDELTEKGETAETQAGMYECRHQINQQKHMLERYENLIKHTELTCNAIMKDMSKQTNVQKLDQIVIKKYESYNEPINRTIDMINNNSSFLGQIYTVIKMGRLAKPKEQDFHNFFKRLIEEELRRQTERWNQDPYAQKVQTEEEAEQAFINKLLNAHIQKMDKPKYVVLDSEYRDRFEKALTGDQVLRTQFQIERQNLAMMLKEGGNFNDTQRMLLIQYKRLYENRVLWLWYLRFRLYSEVERLKIHKWKCLDLTNSYMLFTMIVQNKKQRRNYKRRQAILQGLYADPFDYYQARTYLEQEYMMMRNKKESLNIVMLNTEKYTKAASVFAMSPDLDEAAGALMNVHVGKQIMLYYFELKREGRLVQEKMKMLLKGQHRGVRLMKDGWMMSRKNMRMMQMRYPLIFQRYQYMF